MADQSDVETSLVNLIGRALFGVTDPQTAIPVAGVAVEVYRGWPGSIKLDAVLLASTPGTVVSVFAKDGSERTTSRFDKKWHDSPSTNTLTATVAANVVTFGGNCSVLPLNVAIDLPAGTYTYACVAGDTLTSVAAALAGAIPGASATEAALTCPDAPRRATVGGLGQAVRELRRQVKQFIVTLWTASPLTRDALAKIIDPLLADVIRITMPDGTAAHVWYAWSRSDDGLQRANCYRRDFAYNIEYATTKTGTFYEIVAPSAVVTARDTQTIDRG